MSTLRPMPSFYWVVRSEVRENRRFSQKRRILEKLRVLSNMEIICRQGHLEAYYFTMLKKGHLARRPALCRRRRRRRHRRRTERAALFPNTTSRCLTISFRILFVGDIFYKMTFFHEFVDRQTAKQRERVLLSVGDAVSLLMRFNFPCLFLMHIDLWVNWTSAGVYFAHYFFPGFFSL